MEYNRNHDSYIETHGLGKKFGYKTVLRGVDLSLEKGQSLVIFGPNGAGKSTLIQILCSLLSPSSGHAWIAGLDVRCDREALHRVIGLISHHPLLYPNLTAGENLSFYGAMYETPFLRERIREVLDRVGMLKYKDDMVQGFSRGMQQRVSIARAILHDPEILFLDEPFSGLDQRGGEVLQRMIMQFRRRGKTVIMASHQLRLGIALCDKAAILNSGRIAFLRDAADIPADTFPQIYAEHAGDVTRTEGLQ